MHTIKIRKMGNSLGATLPQEVLKSMNVSEGDTLFLTQTPDGFQITPYDVDFADSMRIFEKTRKRFCNVFHELAK